MFVGVQAPHKASHFSPLHTTSVLYIPRQSFTYHVSPLHTTSVRHLAIPKSFFGHLLVIAIPITFHKTHKYIRKSRTYRVSPFLNLQIVLYNLPLNIKKEYTRRVNIQRHAYMFPHVPTVIVLCNNMPKEPFV